MKTNGEIIEEIADDYLIPISFDRDELDFIDTVMTAARRYEQEQVEAGARINGKYIPFELSEGFRIDMFSSLFVERGHAVLLYNPFDRNDSTNKEPIK